MGGIEGWGGLTVTREQVVEAVRSALSGMSPSERAGLSCLWRNRTTVADSREYAI